MGQVSEELKAALAKLGYRWVYLVEGDSINHYTISDLPEYDAVWDVLERAALASPAGAGTPEPESSLCRPLSHVWADGAPLCDCGQRALADDDTSTDAPRPAGAVPQAGAHTPRIEHDPDAVVTWCVAWDNERGAICRRDLPCSKHAPAPAPTVTPAATKTGMVMVEMPVSLAKTFASNSPSPSGYDRSTDLLASACRKALAAAQEGEVG